MWNTYVAPLMASSKLPSCSIAALSHTAIQAHAGQEPELQRKAAGGERPRSAAMLCAMCAIAM